MGYWVQYLKMNNTHILTDKITKLLADFLGVETTDITPDDSLTQDLHMTSGDLADFVEVLSTAGIDTTALDISDVETLEDLHEKLI